jgi:hypothetical protein
MKYFYLYFIVFSIFSCTKTDESNIEFISLEINSWRKSDYNEVQIIIEKLKSNSSVIVQYKNRRDSLINKNFTIDNSAFENLTKQCIDLENINLKKADLIGLDGKNVTIEFGAKGKSLRYNFWEPTSNANERDLEKFMFLSQNIISISKLKYELLE